MQVLLFVICAAFVVAFVEGARLSEVERVAQWKKNYGTWPYKFHEESEGFRALMAEREREIMQIRESNERWENWLQFIQGQMVYTFTPIGFKLIQMPDEVFKPLHAAMLEGLKNWDNLRTEGKIPVIHGPDSKMHDVPALLRDAQKILLPLHEEWSGMKLKPTSIYGIRMYRNGSSLSMHNDKVYTHVVSSILHLGHEYDNDDEPWPIEIEGHDGKLYQVNLEPGQMLFYESARCLHGRRSVFKGKYYAGLFNHYQPISREKWNYKVDDLINAIPPHWSNGAVSTPGAPVAGCAITTPSRRCANHPVWDGSFSEPEF